MSLRFEAPDIFLEFDLELVQNLFAIHLLKLDFLSFSSLVFFEVTKAVLIGILFGLEVRLVDGLVVSPLVSELLCFDSAFMSFLLLEPLDLCVFLVEELLMHRQSTVLLSLKISMSTGVHVLLLLHVLSVRLHLLHVFRKSQLQLLL